MNMASMPNLAEKARNPPSCFTCDQEILGVKISLSNSVTTHSSSAIPMKISELMGEDFLVILSGEDYICKRCNVLFNLMDRLQSELSIVQNALLGHIRSKYNLPGMSDTNTSSEIQLSVNGVPYSEFARMNNLQSTPSKPQVNNSSLSNSVPNSSSLSNKDKNTHETSNKTTKIYKCGFCDFQSKDLLAVKDHMRWHVNSNEQKKAEKRLGSPISRPIKRKLFRCQVCAASYFDRKSCLNHIKASHSTVDNQSSQNTSNVENVAESPILNSLNLTEDKIVNGEEEAEQKTNKISQNENSETVQNFQAIKENVNTISENGVKADEASIVEKVNDEIDKSSKTVGLDLDAMLAALHSESNTSNNSDAVST